ncbi:MAG: DEAD/DEAH box helicase family protein, partial [Lentisphaeria bacterium]|nr:DEAD/DEAH box helicase family protein [Lentisphaeria bacterium]
MSNFEFEERSYQREAVDQTLGLFDSGAESVLIESPVGSGKTVMGLMVVQELQSRMPHLKVNYVAPRKHILEQMERLNAEYFHCDVVPVSVFCSNPPRADLVILDEAHHEATQSCVDMYE